MFVELKASKGGVLSVKQHWWLTQLSEQGFMCYVVNSKEQINGIFTLTTATYPALGGPAHPESSG